VRLTQIFRQAQRSGIIVNAHRINRGQPPQLTDFRDFYWFGCDPAEDSGLHPAEETAKLVVDIVARRLPAKFHLHPVRDIQVLTPMHRGPVGTIALNERLQLALNAGGRPLPQGNGRLRIGDRVMQTRNDHQREVYNGDLGVVSALDDESGIVRVTFETREVEYDAPELEALVLAYATSIHKSQGSEYPVVVVPFLTSHFVMLSRNLVYTAVTRARKLCVLVADPRALKLALGEVRREERLTGLVERLRNT
jgi:exodeoxyribonuclease V alpha subunit